MDSEDLPRGNLVMIFYFLPQLRENAAKKHETMLPRGVFPMINVSLHALRKLLNVA